MELGGASKADVLTQQSQLAQELATLPALRKQQALVEDQLAVYLGRPPSDMAPLSHARRHRIAGGARATFKLVRNSARMSTRRETLVRSASTGGGGGADCCAWYSSAGYGQAALTTDYIFKSASNVWDLSGSISQPLFHGGQLLHRRRAADAALEQAAAQYRQTVLVAFQNVAQLLRGSGADADALAARARPMTQASLRNLAIAHAQYQAGGVSFLTLLTAERAYHQADNASCSAPASASDTAALFPRQRWWRW